MIVQVTAGERIERGDLVVVKDGVAYRANKTPQDEFIAEATRLMSNRGYALLTKRDRDMREAFVLDFELQQPGVPRQIATVGASIRELGMNTPEGVLNLAASRVRNSLMAAEGRPVPPHGSGP